MQVKKTTETRALIAFATKLEDIQGGGTVAIADLAQAVVNEGTPLGVDANGIYHVVKTAKMQADAAADATTYAVLKGHNFKVGDFVTKAAGAAAYAITAIDTTNEAKDVITVGTTLGAASEGDILIHAAAESADASVAKHKTIGLVGTGFDVIAGDNHTTDIVVRGSVKEALCPPITAAIKAEIPLIRFI